VGVVGRASTDVLALDDPQMAAIMRYIHEHACDPMQVNDLLSIVPLSRRSMERRFFQVRGRSPHEEIRRLQLQRATRLLAQTHLPLKQVAQASGFKSAIMMIRVFRKELGMTPGEHRLRSATSVMAAPSLQRDFSCVGQEGSAPVSTLERATAGPSISQAEPAVLGQPFFSAVKKKIIQTNRR
jgi:AraC-like DNA-binding protein